jgi:hypothetical protein
VARRVAQQDAHIIEAQAHLDLQRVEAVGDLAELGGEEVGRLEAALARRLLEVELELVEVEPLDGRVPGRAGAEEQTTICRPKRTCMPSMLSNSLVL